MPLPLKPTTTWHLLKAQAAYACLHSKMWCQRDMYRWHHDFPARESQKRGGPRSQKSPFRQTGNALSEEQSNLRQCTATLVRYNP
jgi:hypothetical protein